MDKVERITISLIAVVLIVIYTLGEKRENQSLLQLKQDYEVRLRDCQDQVFYWKDELTQLKGESLEPVRAERLQPRERSGGSDEAAPPSEDQ